MLRRGIWDCSFQKSLRSRAEDLRKYAGLMEEVAKLEQASRNVQVPEEHAANTRSLLANHCGPGDHCIFGASSARRGNSRDVSAAGCDAVSSLLDGLAEGLAGCQREAFAEKVKTLRELKHVTMQVCALSDTPVFARSWVELACGPLLKCAKLCARTIPRRAPV